MNVRELSRRLTTDFVVHVAKSEAVKLFCSEQLGRAG